LLLQDLQARNNSLPISNHQLTCTIVSSQGRPKTTIEVADLQRIRSPTGRLNNFALNGLAASLLNIFGHPHSPTAAAADRCAVFNTHDLTRIRYKANDDELWRNVHHTMFWDKPIWLVPIHRRAEEHWVLVAVSVPQQELYFFDSFAEKSGWQRDLRVSSLFLVQTVLTNM
jgi:Ulp1 family protease